VREGAKHYIKLPALKSLPVKGGKETALGRLKKHDQKTTQKTCSGLGDLEQEDERKEKRLKGGSVRKN